jgi:hypothetical protein
MRELGVQRLIASCLNDACRHVALIDVSKYPADMAINKGSLLAGHGPAGLVATERPLVLLPNSTPPGRAPSLKTAVWNKLCWSAQRVHV